MTERTTGTRRKLPAKKDRGKAATAMRLAGASFVEIADTLALPSAAAANELVVEHLALIDVDTEARDTLRAEEAARLERLLRGVWHKATSPSDPEHLPAARVALSIVDRHARLLGLDAPTEVVVYTPTTAELDTWVAGMLERSTPAFDVVEGDVIGAIEA